MAETDPFITVFVEQLRVLARSLQNISEMTVLGIFLWCFTPELYASRPDKIQSLAAFVRSRPAQTVASFLEQTDEVLSHSVAALLGITAPTQISFGRSDRL